MGAMADLVLLVLSVTIVETDRRSYSRSSEWFNELCWFVGGIGVARDFRVGNLESKSGESLKNFE